MTTTPQQQTHTPWRLEHAPTPTNRQRQRIVDASGQWVDLCDREDLNPQIVAAVNACAGLPDPAAALQAAREALELIVDAMKGRVHSTPALAAVEAARAALQQLNGEAQP